MPKLKDKLNKVTESVDRWLWRLVGKENDILFHFLRIALACIALAVLIALPSGSFLVLWKAVPILVTVIVAAAPYLTVIAVAVGITALFVFAQHFDKQRRLRETERQKTLKKGSG